MNPPLRFSPRQPIFQSQSNENLSGTVTVTTPPINSDLEGALSSPVMHIKVKNRLIAGGGRDGVQG